jgi:outer membrane immunogenic protein
MKKIALCGIVVLGVGFAEGALASDLPVWAAPVYQAPIAVVPSWTGFYLGFNAGWGWTGSDEGHLLVASRDISPDTKLFASPVFGGQAGYNIQTGSWVWGIEANVEGASIKADRSSVILPGQVAGFPGGSINFNASQDWIAGVHVRAGYTWGPGMVFLTVGHAWSGITIDAHGLLNTGATAHFTANKIQTAPVVGVGYEWMIAPNWSARTEFLYYNFKGVLSTLEFPGGSTVSTGHAKFNNSIIKIGASYKFDWGAPIATRY